MAKLNQQFHFLTAKHKQAPALENKDVMSAKILTDIEKFLAGGGTITEIGLGVSGVPWKLKYRTAGNQAAQKKKKKKPID